MSMSTATEEGAPMCDINTTPLIDVMLVLLDQLIVTLPIMTHAVKLDMPQTNQPPPPQRSAPEVIDLEIDFDGTIVWNGTVVPNIDTLEGYFRTEAVEGSAAGDSSAPRSARALRRGREGAGRGAAQPHEEHRIRQYRRIQGMSATGA